MSSTSGLVATDVIDFFAYHTLGSPRVMFGCELIETGDLFTQQADGITGLGDFACFIPLNLPHKVLLLARTFPF